MRDYVGLGIQKYGFDAASEGAEALSSRTGVQGYTIRRAGLLEAIFPLRAVALSGGSVPGQTRFGLFGRCRLVAGSEGQPSPLEFQTSYQSRTGFRASGYRLRGA